MFIAARTSWWDCAGTSTGWRIESSRREGSDYTTQAVSGKEGDDAPGCMKVDCREGSKRSTNPTSSPHRGEAGWGGRFRSTERLGTVQYALLLIISPWAIDPSAQIVV